MGLHRQIQQLRTNYSSIPIIAVTSMAVAYGAYEIYHKLRHNPDVMLDKRHNPEPWNKSIHKDGTVDKSKHFSFREFKMPEERPDMKKIEESARIEHEKH
jgi:hypothetical protein